jgi:hypothetical protein
MYGTAASSACSAVYSMTSGLLHCEVPIVFFPSRPNLVRRQQDVGPFTTDAMTCLVAAQLAT